MMTPLLSVVLVNWNAKDYILDCLRSVLESDFLNLEIILIDNASTDSSLKTLKDALTAQELSRIKIIVNDKNYGAARALNQGANLSRGKYLAFLATDTRVAKDCFSEYVRTFEADSRVGALSAKLLVWDQPSRIDSAGEYLSQFGILRQRHAGQEIDQGQFSQPAEIFSAKGTALALRRDVFKKAGGFPEDYFMLLEETDLCWRIWLLGYRIVFVPKAVIYHACGASIKNSGQRSRLIHYFGTRNYLWTMIKNYGLLRLFLVVPVAVLLWTGLALIMLLKGRIKDSGFILKGVFWPLRHPLKLSKQRAKVQRMRLISDALLMKYVSRPVGLRYLLDRVKSW